MSRDLSGHYALPAVYEATPGETILAVQHNTPLEDLEADANLARPIVAGGTAATTAIGGFDAFFVGEDTKASAATLVLTGLTQPWFTLSGTTGPITAITMAAGTTRIARATNSGGVITSAANLRVNGSTAGENFTWAQNDTLLISRPTGSTVVNVLLISGGVVKGADIAAASTLALNTASHELAQLTGATTITAVTLGEGRSKTMIATSAVLLTASASLIVNGTTAGNHRVPANTLVQFVGYAAGVVRAFTYNLSPDGSSSTAGIGFSVDEDVGLYRPGTNQLGFTAGGATTTLQVILDGPDGSFRPAAGGSNPNIGNGTHGWGVVYLDGSFGSLQWTTGTGIFNNASPAYVQIAGGLYAQGGITLDGNAVQNQAIRFPATATLSANTSTLDEYNEFTWTVALQIGGAATGITYSSRSGTGTKIGNAIVEHFNFTLSANGALTGALTVTGSAYTVATLTSAAGAVGIASSFTGLTGALQMDKNASAYRLFQSTATGNTTLTQTALTATTSLRAGIAHSTAT